MARAGKKGRLLKRAIWAAAACLLLAMCACSAPAGAPSGGASSSQAASATAEAVVQDRMEASSEAQGAAPNSADGAYGADADASAAGTSASSALAPSGEGSSASAHAGATEAAKLLSSLTLEQKIAQMFIVSGESLCSDASTLTYVDDDVRSNLAATPVGGVCMLESSLVDPDQAATLAKDLQAASRELVGVDMLLCVDEEGGTVSRIGANPAFPESDLGDMRVIGDAGDVQAARDAAHAIGTYLRQYGFNVDFAPVADIDDPPGGTMYERSFGSSADAVSPMVAAQVEGFGSARTMSCAKHYPGIGSAAGDSHEQSIETGKTLDELSESDLRPFQAAIDAGVPMIMVGHISCPNITGDAIPATFSPTLITDVLRGQLGFQGVVVTDSLAMDAAQQAFGDAEASVRAIEAGADIALMPIDFQAAYLGVLQAVESGRISEQRIDESVTRILEMKLAYAG